MHELYSTPRMHADETGDMSLENAKRAKDSPSYSSKYYSNKVRRKQFGALYSPLWPLRKPHLHWPYRDARVAFVLSTSLNENAFATFGYD